MNIKEIHLEIAKERFLELLATSKLDIDSAAKVAISDANIFIAEYKKAEEVEKGPEWTSPLKGCSACFGSGGKKTSPCKICKGTGKVYYA